MKKIQDKLKLNRKDKKSFYDKLKDSLDFEGNFETNNLFHNRHSKYKNREQDELKVGLTVLFLVILIIFSLAYYYVIFQPSMEEINNEKNNKINQINSIFKDDLSNDPTRQVLINQVSNCDTIEELNNLDVKQMAYPAVKSHLTNKINELKDPYNRIEIVTNNSTDIMSTDDANNYINYSSVDELTSIDIKKVDTVIIPLSISRLQAASGLIKEGDTVDIYQLHNQTQDITPVNESDNNTNISIEQARDSRIVGGALVVSILRSKDSGVIDSEINLEEYPQSRNFSQSAKLDLNQVLATKASGTLDEKQLNILLSHYGWNLSNYERITNLGDLDVQYMVMVEVPKDQAESLLSNVDNIVLTIPTYDAPSWVNLTN